MTISDWIVVCLLGIILAGVVTALHRNNNGLRRRYEGKQIMTAAR